MNNLLIMLLRFTLYVLRLINDMSVPTAKLQEAFTYADYVTWPDGERWELIHGVAYNMSPAPSPEHQRVSRRLSLQFDRFLAGSDCEVFYAPLDVRLPDGEMDDEMIETVVQPDIFIICDPSKIDDKGCKGAPDLIIEVLSPSTIKIDLEEKFALYEAHGVKEYWVVYPFDHVVEVFHLESHGSYGKRNIYAEDDIVSVNLLAGLEIDLALVFGLEKKTKDPDKPPQSWEKE